MEYIIKYKAKKTTFGPAGIAYWRGTSKALLSTIKSAKILSFKPVSDEIPTQPDPGRTVRPVVRGINKIEIHNGSIKTG